MAPYRRLASIRVYRFCDTRTFAIPTGCQPSAQLERFAAFATVGVFFGLAYPRRLVLDWSFLIAAAGMLEGAQRLTSDRHGHLRDAVAKALGGTFGIGAALLVLAVVAYYRPLVWTFQPADQTGASTVQHQDSDPRA
jgi:hypothetical protein